MFAVAIVQLEHLRHPVGNLRDLDEQLALESEARQNVVAVGVRRVVGVDFVKSERDGPRHLVEVKPHLAPVAFDHHPGLVADGPVQQLGAMDAGGGLGGVGIDPRRVGRGGMHGVGWN
jgi:hypothetical protein